MKLKHLTALLLLAAVFLFAFSERNTKKHDPAEVKAIIDKKNTELEELYLAGKIEEASLHFAEDMIQMPLNQPPMVGREDYVKRWKEVMQFGKWTFDFMVQEVRVSGDQAVELGAYTLKFEPNDGAPFPNISDEGNYLVLWEYRDKDWHIVWDAPVSSLPCPQM